MSDNVIEVRGLGKRYGTVTAVAGLDLSVPRGSLFGLLGPNGAGKSTTFGVLCGFLQPTAGSATVLGIPSAAVFRLRGRIAALPQDAAFPRQVSVRAELVHFGRLIGLAPARAHSEAERVLEVVGLKEAAARRGGELSHGMLKRVGLAQALIGEPELLFLDEPTAGLDPAASRQTKDLIASLVPRATVVLSSHNLAEVQEICTHGAILDRGRLMTAGTIAELTHRGAEVWIEVGAGAEQYRRGLEEAFGAQSLSFGEGRFRITFDARRDSAEVIAIALRLLLDAKVPILGVQRGTSLETAFLKATSEPD